MALKRRKARIVGLGSYVPERILSNSDLEKIVNTSDEWITTRTGMKERRIAGSEECTSDMGVEAALVALKRANISADSIDLILCATLTPDYMFPSTACLMQERLGASRAAALDIQAACSGYLYAIAIAKSFIEAQMYNNVLIIASEKLSSIVDYEDRSTCVLFGDGAAACVVSNEGKGLLIRNTEIGCDGKEADLLILPGGGAKHPATEKSVAERMHYIKMEGKEIFKHAVRKMGSAAQKCLERASIKEEEISWFVPHQANARIIEAMAKRFNIPMDKVFMTIHKYGNTSASSVGIAIDELLQKEQLKQGDHLLLVAFGAGLTWGASILTYGENFE